jgi:hypothetical protein
MVRLIIKTFLFGVIFIALMLSLSVNAFLKNDDNMLLCILDETTEKKEKLDEKCNDSKYYNIKYKIERLFPYTEYTNVEYYDKELNVYYIRTPSNMNDKPHEEMFYFPVDDSTGDEMVMVKEMFKILIQDVAK